MTPRPVTAVTILSPLGTTGAPGPVSAQMNLENSRLLGPVTVLSTVTTGVDGCFVELVFLASFWARSSKESWVAVRMLLLLGGTLEVCSNYYALRTSLFMASKQFWAGGQVWHSLLPWMDWPTQRTQLSISSPFLRQRYRHYRTCV